jgi:TolB-like protein
MPGVSNAVFLSYASEDAPAAQRIADALRAGGIEVWFDREELRGGDAWDQKIRQQIRDCRLFLPIISANTEARLEGYFRREWKLAVDRTEDMAGKVAFLLPIVIDDTPNATAEVPERFRHVQWTRLRAGEATPAFVALINQLLTRSSQTSDPSRGVQAPSPGAPSAPARASPPKPRRPRRQLAMIGAACSVVIAALGYFAYNRFGHPGSATATTAAPAAMAGTDKSIAVLPFTDLSEKHDQEYFADGMAEEILNLLTRIPQLRVIGRTSSFSFRGKEADLPSIGRALGVAYLIEGSVRPLNNRIRITAQLLDARDGSDRWSDTFEGAAADAFRLQDEIALRVAHSLNLELAGQLPQRSAIPPEAYDYYLRGLRELDEGSAANLDAARSYFNKSLAVAPRFVPAAVQKARADLVNYVNGVQADVFGKQAHASIDAALKLDPKNAAAHAVKAEILTAFDWNWTAAEVEVRQATDLGGGLEAQAAGARLAVALGDFARGRSMLEDILTTNPFDPYVFVRMAWWSEFPSGHYAEAESLLRRSLQIAGKQAGGEYQLGVAQLMEGRLEDALASMKQEKTDEGQLVGLALVYTGMGRKTESDAALSAMQKNGFYFPTDFAHVYALRGDTDHAFSYLERAYTTRDPYLWSIKSDPLLKNLRGDPRYKAFLRKMNLPE